MRRLWVTRDIDAPADVAWAVLTDLALWPEWGPSVRSAELRDGADALALGVTGHVTTAVGVRLPFRITAWNNEMRSWSWRVGGVAATDHAVQPLGAHRCRVGFGVPLVAAPYLAVCRVALARIDHLAVSRR